MLFPLAYYTYFFFSFFHFFIFSIFSVDRGLSVCKLCNFVGSRDWFDCSPTGIDFSCGRGQGLSGLSSLRSLWISLSTLYRFPYKRDARIYSIYPTITASLSVFLSLSLSIFCRFTLTCLLALLCFFKQG